MFRLYIEVARTYFLLVSNWLILTLLDLVLFDRHLVNTVYYGSFIQGLQGLIYSVYYSSSGVDNVFHRFHRKILTIYTVITANMIFCVATWYHKILIIWNFCTFWQPVRQPYDFIADSSAYWVLRGALNILSQEILRAPKAFGSFMIIRPTLECSHWWEIVYMRMLSGRHFFMTSLHVLAIGSTMQRHIWTFFNCYTNEMSIDQLNHCQG